MKVEHHLKGRIYVIFAGALWSIGGPLIRLLEQASEWQFLFYRSLVMLLVLLLVLKLQNPGKLRLLFLQAGKEGVIGGAFLAIAFVTFLFSITHTTVANTLFLMSSSPIIAALMGFALLQERPSRTQWIAMVGAVIGIGIMIQDGIANGNIFGNLLGLLTAVGFAGFSTSLRWGKSKNMLPAVCYAGIFSIGVCSIMIVATKQNFIIPVSDITIALLYGSVGMAMGMLFYIAGSKFIEAAELTLLSLSEVILGPIWVMLFFSEVPSLLTIIGGSVLIASIIFQSLAKFQTK